LVEFEIAVLDNLTISRSSGQSDDKRLEIEMLDYTHPAPSKSGAAARKQVTTLIFEGTGIVAFRLRASRSLPEEVSDLLMVLRALRVFSLAHVPPH
jgi:hypothetical protein